MATLTLTAAASSDDAMLDDNGYDDTLNYMNIGTPGAAVTPADSGSGWRFTNVTLNTTDVINSAILKLMKITTSFAQQNNRWTFANEDNSATFSSGSPPGSRAIVATIVVDNNNVNETDGTVYNFPRAGSDQITFGVALALVTARGGWASGNAVSAINQSKQDVLQGSGFARKTFHSFDSSVSASEPQLTIDYTVAAAPASSNPSQVRSGRQTGIGGGFGSRR